MRSWTPSGGADGYPTQTEPSVDWRSSGRSMRRAPKRTAGAVIEIVLGNAGGTVVSGCRRGWVCCNRGCVGALTCHSEVCDGWTAASVSCCWTDRCKVAAGVRVHVLRRHMWSRAPDEPMCIYARVLHWWQCAPGVAGGASAISQEVIVILLLPSLLLLVPCVQQPVASFLYPFAPHCSPFLPLRTTPFLWP